MSTWIMMRPEGRALGMVEANDASDAAQRAFTLYGPPITIADPGRRWTLAIAASAQDRRADRAEAETRHTMGLG